MIYTASYFQKERHYGKKFSISRSEPKGISIDGKLEMFVPDGSILADYKKRKIDEKGYIDRYREQMQRNLPQIKAWLQQLKPEEDVTLMCWERPGQFCHRNLVIKFVERYRPDCYGGQDVVG